MSHLVYVSIIPHDPTLPKSISNADSGHPVFKTMRDSFARLREGLDSAQPDVIVMASGDHFNQWFYTHVPTFAVGKSEVTTGPFPWEKDVYGIDQYSAPGHHELGRHILEGMLAKTFDMCASDEYKIDHGFTVPLNFVRPEQDIPIVPVWTNVLLPPLPPGERYYDLGVALRAVIESFPGQLRVAVIGTGHMTNSVGGPAMLRYADEPLTPWDVRTWDLFTTGRVKDLLPDCTWDKLYEQGNGTPGFMGHLVAWGVAGGRVPSWANLTSAPVTFSQAFVEWNEECLQKGKKG